MIDFVNSMFQIGASVAICLNIYKTYQYQSAKGISLISLSFYILWGFWNLYYFNSLNQMFSLIMSYAVVTLNIIWLFQIYLYQRKEIKCQKLSKRNEQEQLQKNEIIYQIKNLQLN